LLKLTLTRRYAKQKLFEIEILFSLEWKDSAFQTFSRSSLILTNRCC
jgi:hypothetical protein